MLFKPQFSLSRDAYRRILLCKCVLDYAFRPRVIDTSRERKTRAPSYYSVTLPLGLYRGFILHYNSRKVQSGLDDTPRRLKFASVYIGWPHIYLHNIYCVQLETGWNYNTYNFSSFFFISYSCSRGSLKRLTNESMVNDNFLSHYNLDDERENVR